MTARAALLALFALPFGAGCNGCRNDHPYVPPAISATASGGASAAPVPTSPGDGGAIAAEPALVAPPGATRWVVEGMTLEAGGREIVSALVRDFDGDGQKDALAIIRPIAAERKPGASTGEVVFFRGGEGARIPAAIASGPPLGMQPSCAATARLERVGTRAAFAEIGNACPRGPGSRLLAVVRLTPPMPTVAFDAVAIDPAFAPRLTVDVDSVDRDHDGLDDTVLHLGLEGGEGKEAPPKVAGVLAFFDRPAGPSRDPDEPDASLKALAAQAMARAPKAKEAASVPPLVGQIRALYRAMCLEGGSPRITKIHGGGAAPCGPSKPLEDAGVAEVRAWVAQGDALRAFAAEAMAQGAPATKTAARSAELAKLLADVAPVTEAKNVRVLSATPDAPNEHHPEWGPITFDPAGKLLVRRSKAVVRVDPTSAEEEATEVAPWRDEVLSPDGKSRWLEAYHACEGVSLRATFAPTGDGDIADVLLPIAPRLGKSCSGKRGEAATAVPLSWSSRGLEALVGGQPVLVKLEGQPTVTALPTLLDEVPPPGSARSPNGRAIALAVAQGILVRGQATPKPWTLVHSPLLEPYGELRRCTVNDEATAVACVRRGRAILINL